VGLLNVKSIHLNTLFEFAFNNPTVSLV
jgi:hypothetical protein